MSGDNSGILKREIQSIQELLDEQPDSKCLFRFISGSAGYADCEIGCMESLVHYKQLLVRNHSTSLESGEDDNLIASCLGLLRQLETIDPLRRQRYGDLGEHS